MDRPTPTPRSPRRSSRSSPAAGVRHAVLSPGSRSTPLALALWRQPAIEVTVIVDERSAGFFALGAAQATRHPGGDPLHLGHRGGQPPPGGLRGRRGGVPLIVLTADRPPELRGIGAGQTIDQIKLYGVGGALVLRGRHPRRRRRRPPPLPLGRLPRLRRRRAASPRPGPVHLNLALARAARRRSPPRGRSRPPTRWRSRAATAGR